MLSLADISEPAAVSRRRRAMRASNEPARHLRAPATLRQNMSGRDAAKAPLATCLRNALASGEEAMMARYLAKAAFLPSACGPVQALTLGKPAVVGAVTENLPSSPARPSTPTCAVQIKTTGGRRAKESPCIAELPEPPRRLLCLVATRHTIHATLTSRHECSNTRHNGTCIRTQRIPRMTNSSIVRARSRRASKSWLRGDPPCAPIHAALQSESACRLPCAVFVRSLTAHTFELCGHMVRN